jgi:hypothetical protein
VTQRGSLGESAYAAAKQHANSAYAPGVTKPFPLAPTSLGPPVIKTNNFNGHSETQGLFPPDTHGAIGRLDYLDNRPVAALIYQRRKHFINLFVWPAAPDAARTPKTITRQGYQLLHWVDSDFNYWAVSDVNEKDLQGFKQLFEEQIAHH